MCLYAFAYAYAFAAALDVEWSWLRPYGRNHPGRVAFMLAFTRVRIIGIG